MTDGSGATARSISKEALAELPIRRYEGRTILVTMDADAAAAAADFATETVVGFDTETRPAFHKGESYLPSLVQLATANAVYLFQLRRSEFFPLLQHVMENAALVKAGVAIADDLRTLKQVIPFAEQNMIDLGIAARNAGFQQTGVRNLSGICLGYRIAKGAKTTNWAARDLTPVQIAYAATDAWASRELYLALKRQGVIG
jgi:ribonuclease D